MRKSDKTINERRIKRRELREMLKESEHGIDQLIEKEILPEGCRLRKNSHPFWLLSDVRKAESKLREDFAPQPFVNKGAPIRPLSEKVLARVIAAREAGRI